MMKSPTHILRTGSTYLQDLVNGVRAGGILAGTNGVDWFFDPANGSDSGNSGQAADEAFASLEAAEDAATANRHDAVWYIAGSSGTNLTEQLVWDKSYTHLFGICAPTFSSQRSRIFQLSTATGLSPLINFTATGCIVDNIEVFQGVADATSLINVQVTGGRNAFSNVHFAGGGNATMAIDNCASLMINGGEENKFVNCKLGVTTIPLATGGNVLRFDGSAKENMFVNCTLSALIGNSGARLVELVDTASVDQFTYFYNTKFLSNSVNKATTMASAFEIPSGHTTTATLYIDKLCGGMGFTDWDDDNRGLIYLEGGTITAGGNSGIAQVSNST